MQGYIAKNKNAVIIKVATTFIAIAAAIALPQIFHAIGLASGLGGNVGAAFLPMHLPVLLAGLAAGPLAGLAAGLISPVLSFAISGMPAVAMLPFMTIELAFYGLTCGLLQKTKMPTVLKLLLAQIAGRLFRAAAILLAIYGFNHRGLTVAQAYNIVLIGLPGIVLQWVIIPLLMYRIKALKKTQ